MNRYQLIALSLKYNGDYNLIAKAFYNNEEIDAVYNIKALTILDNNYPPSLLELKQPPLVLFYKGNIKLLDNKIVGVIGSRTPSEYAISKTVWLVNNLIHDYTIVSGMAKGIDTIAHLCAINTSTIAVLGCGIDYVYPKENLHLYKELINKHLVISEYPGLIKPYAFHFPFRNRIIAALSKKLYVLEAKERSGTLITVNEALNLGKDIYALPFNIDDKNGIGTNRLIQEGANMILLDHFD